MKATPCLGALLLLSLLGGCASMGGANRGATLAALPQPQLPEKGTARQLTPPSIEEVEASYESVLAVAQAPELRQQVAVRLADLAMDRGERDQLEATEPRAFFDAAIDQYQAVLQQPQALAAAGIDRDRLLYRLAKAYALDGRMDEADATLGTLLSHYPTTRFAAEAWFRRAEHAFIGEHYVAAENHYQQVIDRGEANPFYLNAVYMLGWSQFKNSRFENSVASFTQVLDRLLPPPAETAPLNLRAGQSGLVDDTLRVLAIAFSYLDGAPAVTETYQALGQRHYQARIYQRLAELYLDQERYRDAADTYQHFIEQFPLAEQGPLFSQRVTEIYLQAGYHADILPTKRAFVANYGVHSAYWAQADGVQRDTLRPVLSTYLTELSSFFHAEAQALLAAHREYQRRRSAGLSSGSRPEPSAPLFLQAAHYYRIYLDTFPEDQQQGRLTFLMAEAYLEAGQLERAIHEYERVAYQWLDPAYGASAGYAALLAVQSLRADAGPEQAEHWRERELKSAMNFADYYPQDEQAVPVLTHAAQQLFDRGEQARAMALAQRIVTWQPPAGDALEITAWLIIAHSQFEQEQYIEAEAAYRQVLALLPEGDARLAGTRERVAASRYRTAEQLVAQGELESAVEQLLSIERVAPESGIAVNAVYDAGNYLLDLEQWQRAEGVFSEFARRYPAHRLTATLAPKFAVIYQAQERWDQAADALAQMANSEDDPALQRQSLYRAGELYQKSGRSNQAAQAYADYVRRFPQPFDLATEARFQLVELAPDQRTRERWLRQLIDANEAAGEQRTVRSEYLAAYAANEFASFELARFESIKLTLPIRTSLSAKQRALEQTLAAYQKVIDYGIPEFVTEANFRIGTVYAQLSRDLLDSERPRGLDALAMEQYEILLEEQAFPFEEQSVDLLETNVQRAWSGTYDRWVERSLEELARILPARYGKQEAVVEVSRGIH